MSLTRRRLFQFAARARENPHEWVSARGREAAVAEGAREHEPNLIRLASTENPVGPGQHVLDAIAGKFSDRQGYPFNAQQHEPVLIEAIARKLAVSSHTVTLGSGSGEILTNAVRAFTSPSKPYVAANPTWESPGATARKIGTSVRLVDLDENLRVDLEKLADAAQGAGLVYFCNPNNPTATVHGAGIVDDFVKQVHSASPDTVVVIDEAYHDYVTEPSYRTAAEIAKTTPRVIVTRSMSKAYGMAGMRVGYAVGDRQIISALARFRMPYGINLPAIAAASVALANQAHIDAERKRNAEVRAFTLRAFEQLGFKASASETNFIFVELDRSAKTFRAACARHGVIVGRDFPPLEGTHCRISLGTMSEMQKAVAIFKKVLGSMAAPTKL